MATSFLGKIRNGFLKFFGDLKVFPYPLFLLYDPGGYKVKGDDIRRLIKEIEPGDIMVRGYKNYLDGYFIPGFFSHAGLYLGEVKDVNLHLSEKGKALYREGEQMVIHSMADGVFMEDVINFCRCDFLLLLRRNERIEPGLDLEKENPPVFTNALASLGDGYDFKFDFSDFHNMSCTEFVYYCCRGFIEKYKVGLKARRALFTKIDMIIPDDFVTEEFDIVFQSTSVKQEKLDKIIAKNRADKIS
ncbi:MAG: YiiX/YebB-like N1pC/P60 family cysteine hydrolase [Bacteroidota bacterium]